MDGTLQRFNQRSAVCDSNPWHYFSVTMVILYILLIVAGALPMTVFLLKRRGYRRILQAGVKTTAEITHIKTQRYNKGGNYDRVLFAYLPAGAGQYLQGAFITKVGKYKRGEQLDIYYLPQQPQKHAVPGSSGEVFFFIFTLVIFLFVLFACFKIQELVKADTTTYKFELPWKQ